VPRAEACTIDANEEMPADVGDLDLADHCRHATRWWNCSQVELGSLEDYKGTRFYNSQQALVVERWLNRVEEDASGLTFEEWNPTQEADASQPPVAMLIKSSELRAAGFTLREVISPALEAAARGGRRRYGAGLLQLQGMGPERSVLSVDNDNEFMSRSSECVKNHVLVDSKLAIFVKIKKSREKLFEEKKTLFLEVSP